MAKALSKKNSNINSFDPDFEIIKKAATTFRALNHKTRQKILRLLDQQGELPVTKIYILTQSKTGESTN